MLAMKFSTRMHRELATEFCGLAMLVRRRGVAALRELTQDEIRNRPFRALVAICEGALDMVDGDLVAFLKTVCLYQHRAAQ